MQFNGFTKKTGSLTNAAVVDYAIRFVEEKSRKFNTSIQVENIEKRVQRIKGNDKQMSTINQSI